MTSVSFIQVKSNVASNSFTDFENNALAPASAQLATQVASGNFSIYSNTGFSGTGQSVAQNDLLINQGSLNSPVPGHGGAFGYSPAATLAQGAGLVNDANAQISGGAGTSAVAAGGGANDVFNAGSILQKGASTDPFTGTTSYGFGVSLATGGTVSNTATGSIAGGTGIDAADTATIVNAGSIHGAHGNGVALHGSGVVVNAASASIDGSDGAIAVSGSGAATIVNAGTIGGDGSGSAIAFMNSGDDTLGIVAGSSIHGLVQGGTGANTLELFSGATGSLSGIGSQYVGFQTVAVDANAHWTLGAGNALNAGTIRIDRQASLEIAGKVGSNETVDMLHGSASLQLDHAGSFAGTIRDFSHGDSVDLANLQYAAGLKTSFDQSGNTTTLNLGQGAGKVSLAFQGDYNNGNVAIGSDGHGGTLVSYHAA